MARVPRCDRCGRPEEWDDAAREYHCPECDEGDLVDELTAPPEGFSTHEYDEEDRP